MFCPPNVGAHPRRLRRASHAGGVGCRAMLGRLFGAILHKLDAVRSAPLPERAFSALGLKCIPLFQTLFRCEKFFETPVGSAVAKAGLHVRIPMGQSFLRKLERQSLAEVEIVLVRNQDIAIGGSRSSGRSSSSIGLVSETQ